MAALPDFTATDAERLADFLDAPERPQGTMSYCELAGFLFAVACSPELVRPSEWIPLVFDEQDANFHDAAQAQDIMQALLALHDHIAVGVLTGAPALPPGCAVRARPMLNLRPDAPLSQWASGFCEGCDWLSDVWTAYAADTVEEELGAAMVVLSFFSSRRLAEAYRKELRPEFDSLAALAADTVRALPAALQSYAAIGRALGQTVH
jgi:uncharacterized protein